jgi:mannosyltransferase
MTGLKTAAPTSIGENQHARTELVLSLALLAAISIAAAWFRLYQIGAKGFWMDEGITTAYMRLDWYNLARLLWRREANMSFYFFLLTGWLQFGNSEAWYRGFSALTAVATVPVMYAIGSRLFGPRAGLASALLLAVNAYHVRYAQDARSYSLTIFLVTLATYCFIRGVDTGKRVHWRWYVVFSALSVYSHFFGILAVAAHWASIRSLPPVLPPRADSSDARQGFYRAAQRILLWTLPVWVFIATTGVGVLSWMKRPGLGELYGFLEQFAGNGGWPLLGAYLICFALALIPMVRGWRRQGRSLDSWRYAVAFDWLIIPVLITLAATLVRPVFLPRYLSISMPAYCLIAAAGITSFRRRWLAVPMLGLICWLGWRGIRSYYERDFDVLRADYRSATRYVIERARSGDAILFYPSYGRFAYDYYAARLIDAKSRPMILYPGQGDRLVWRDFMGKASPQVLDSATQDYRRVWFMLSNYTGPQSEDQPSQQIKTAIGRRFHEAGVYDFTGARLYLYAPQDPGGAPREPR